MAGSLAVLALLLPAAQAVRITNKASDVLGQDLGQLMYNAAQRAKGWIDGDQAKFSLIEVRRPDLQLQSHRGPRGGVGLVQTRSRTVLAPAAGHAVHFGAGTGYNATSRDQCDVPDGQREDCGFMGVNQGQCEARGCCWRPGGQGAPWCFHNKGGAPAALEKGQCAVPDHKRRDCGFMGVNQGQCEGRGCCWRPGGPGAPWCFHQEDEGGAPADKADKGGAPAVADDGQCAVPEGEKQDCGFYGVTKDSCENKGCCWRETFHGGIWCFHKKGGGGASEGQGSLPEPVPEPVLPDNHTCDVLVRQDCGFYGVTQASCVEKGCCWKPGAHGEAWCFHSQDPSKQPALGSQPGDEAVPASEIGRAIIGHEAYKWTTLMHRYNQASDLLEKAGPGAAGRDAVNMIFCWLRYSQTRQLTWQRNYNTKPREVSHATERLNRIIAMRWKDAATRDKDVYRLMLGTIGRGGSGGDGQAIRDEILHIMHRHHLPEVKGTFIEEWHQKLHNNATPDDIIICEAFLAFLRSGGNLDEFWRVIHEGGITRDTLRKYDRPITTDPVFFADKKDGLIHDFNNYLRILKNVFSGADLEKSFELCRGYLGGRGVELLQGILSQRGATGEAALAVIDSITEARQLLGARLVVEGDIIKVRDMLYLDLGLESQMRLMAETAVSTVDQMEIKTRTRVLALWASLAMENLVYNYAPGVGPIQGGEEARFADELKAVLRDWVPLLEEARNGYGGDWPTRAMSVVDRMRRAMGTMTDIMQDNLQAKAEFLGYGLLAVTPEKLPEEWAIERFSEELVRGGGGSFVLSSFLRKLDKAIRAEGGGELWQVISQGDPGAKGWMIEVPDIMSIQAETFDRPTILLAHSLGGEEEVPPGVVGIITPDAPDVLAHISVRARNLKVLFATCFDPDEFEGLARFVSKKVDCKLAGNRVTVEEMTGEMATGSGAEASVTEGDAGIKIDLPPPAEFSVYALPESAVDPDAKPKIFGAKSMNIVKARRTLPDWIQTPRSAVVPFGVFEKVLSLEDNKEVADEYARLVNEDLGSSDDPLPVLEELRSCIRRLRAPAEMVEDVRQALVDSEIIEPGQLQGSDWDDAFMALKGVWASKWNDRAYYSCKKAGIDMKFVQMAVLIQRLVEAEYAFVLHSVNPSTNDPAYMYGEVVVGLGETLVGNFPGRALGFQMKKDSSAAPEIQSLPSKSTGLFGGGLIFRSDSNGEDLPGFAGAGLYDSIPMVTNTEKTLQYYKERLVTDKAFADDLMRGLANVAVDIENAYDGAPQDIEGCYKDGKFFVVQTRPQV